MWIFLLRHKYIILALLVCAFSAANLFRVITYRDFSYTSAEGKIVINLKNTRYIALDSRIDHIANDVALQTRPFANATFLSTITKDIDFFMLNRTDTQDVESGDNKKVIIAHQTSPNNLTVGYDIYTLFPYQHSLYYTQIDYSGDTTLLDNGTTISFTDNSCAVSVKKVADYNYTIVRDKTIMISTTYTNNLHMDINLSIKCH